MKPANAIVTYSKKFFEIKFTSDTMKAAYLRACKWYATNVLSKDELHNVQVEFIKGQDEQQFPTVTICLYAALNEEELRERHCKICRETHGLFYANNNFNCNRCDVNAYQRRADDILRVKTEYYREMLNKKVGGS